MDNKPTQGLVTAGKNTSLNRETNDTLDWL